MSNDVEEVKARLNIVDVVGDYVRLERAGAGQWKGLCPFHKERSASFTVSEERQLWHCFGCGKGGDIFSFVMEQESMEFREALVTLAERAGVDLLHKNNSGVSVDKKKVLFKILDLATQFYQKQLSEGVGMRKALPYLTDRGINNQSIETFRLGFAPDGWRYITDFLIKRGYSVEDLITVGLVIPKDRAGNVVKSTRDVYDRFRGRIMFPITDPLGRVIGFTGRILPSNENEKSAKYINTSASLIYDKSSVLYGIFQAKQSIKDKKRIVVVEGNMDVIATHQSGISETVAVSGTALTQQHAQILRRYAAEIVLFFDNDVAGQKAAFKSSLICIEVGLRVKIVIIDDDAKDAADIALENVEKLVSLIDDAKDVMVVFFDQAFSMHDSVHPDGQKKIMTMLVPLISAYSASLDQEYWKDELAARAQISSAAINEFMEEYKSSFHSSYVERNDVVKTEKKVLLKNRSDNLLDQILFYASQSDDLFLFLINYEFPKKFLEQKKILLILRQSVTQDIKSYPSALSCIDDKTALEYLESILKRNDAEMTSIIVMKTVDEILEEARNIIDTMIQAWRKEERSRIITKLAEAERFGDSEAKKIMIDMLQKNT